MERKISVIIAGSRLYILYALLGTIIFSELVLNSICIILLFASWLFEGNLRGKWNLLKKDRLFMAYALYFVVQASNIFNAPDLYSGWCAVEGKLGFFIIPLILCTSSFINAEIRTKSMMAFSLLLTLASLYCLSVNAILYMQHPDDGLFFYHRLVSAIGQHAVYFSVYIFISLVFLLQRENIPTWLQQRKWLRLLWIFYWTGFIVLLSSKIVLCVSLLYFLYVIIYHSPVRFKKWRPLLLLTVVGMAAAVIFLFDNPVRKRFDDLFGNNIAVLRQQQYTPADYFNGLEFRLLLWRFTFEILRDKHDFVWGVGSVHAQSALNEKYYSENMYAGDKNRKDQGYLNYNCHNQFLQVSLQSGVIGLAVFLFWCYMMLIKTIRKRSTVLSGIMFLIFIFFFSESVFERQYGMILCTVFPLLFLYPEQEEKIS